MRLQSEFAAEAWYCQFSSGTKGCFMASIKGEKRARQTWSSVGQDEQQHERQRRLQKQPLLPPIHIHFNGKFVVKCPPQND